MKKGIKLGIEPFRIEHPNGGMGDANNGMFMLKSPKDRSSIMVIISDGLGWEHVSISRQDKTPTWEEMCHIKDMIFDDDEVVIQYHPKKKDYVNMHQHCLHMWRPINEELPIPPSILVGIKG